MRRRLATRALVRSAMSRRTHPSPAAQILWDRIRGARVDGIRFRRSSVVLGQVVAFYAPRQNVVVEFDGVTLNEAALVAAGLRVVRVPGDLPTRLDDALGAIRQQAGRVVLDRAEPPPLIQGRRTRSTARQEPTATVTPLQRLESELGQQGRRVGQDLRYICPLCRSRRRTLAVRELPDQNLWLYCFEGCSKPALLSVIGWSYRDLYARRES